MILESGIHIIYKFCSYGWTMPENKIVHSWYHSLRKNCTWQNTNLSTTRFHTEMSMSWSQETDNMFPCKEKEILQIWHWDWGLRKKRLPLITLVCPNLITSFLKNGNLSLLDSKNDAKIEEMSQRSNTAGFADQGRMSQARSADSF